MKVKPKKWGADTWTLTKNNTFCQFYHLPFQFSGTMIDDLSTGQLNGTINATTNETMNADGEVIDFTNTMATLSLWYIGIGIGNILAGNF